MKMRAASSVVRQEALPMCPALVDEHYYKVSQLTSIGCRVGMLSGKIHTWLLESSVGHADTKAT